MSVKKWSYIPEKCDGQICPSAWCDDCSLCELPDEDWEDNIAELSGLARVIDDRKSIERWINGN